MSTAEPPPELQKIDVGDPAAFAIATNIDRRTCTRTVPLKVICLGLSRSGTSSLRQALIDLGYSDCYHYSAILNENPPDARMWVEALEAKYLHIGKPFTRADWDQLLGHCQAVTDTPCVIFYKELLEAYPDAKVVLTVRDSADAWAQSQLSTVAQWFKDYVVPAPTWLGRFYQRMLPFDPSIARLNDLIRIHFDGYSTLLYDLEHGTSTAETFYEEYVAAIKRIVPADKLLVMNVKQGWQPLCDFLDKDVPAYPFPRKNDNATFKKNLTKLDGMLRIGVFVNIAKYTMPAAVAVFAAGFAAYRYSLQRL